MMLTAGEIRAALAPIDPRVLTRLYEALRARRVYEAERILAEQTGDAVRATEVIASLVRREVRAR